MIRYIANFNLNDILSWLRISGSVPLSQSLHLNYVMSRLSSATEYTMFPLREDYELIPLFLLFAYHLFRVVAVVRQSWAFFFKFSQ